MLLKCSGKWNNARGAVKQFRRHNPVSQLLIKTAEKSGKNVAI